MYYLVVGEPSGDLIGSYIVKSLQKNSVISGVFGPQIEFLCGKSLFDIEEISVGGFTEVVPKLLKVRRLIKATVKDVLEKNSKVLITIDSPEFCFRVARLVKQANKNIKMIHVVAPTVWAWRPQRAKKMALIYDHILTLFDFEPPYFEKYGLKATFIGHPCIEDCEYVTPKLDENGDTIVLMPGSRIQEIKALLPIFVKAITALKQKENVVILTLPHLVQSIKNLAPNIKIECQKRKKKDIIKNARIAVVASGTATLELALLNCPMLVCYKLSAFSYFIAKLFVTTKYISIVNIVLNKKIVPELIQSQCTADNICTTMNTLLADTASRQNQIANFDEFKEKLRPGSNKPSVFATSIIESYLNNV
jgi:lipid-A-disaccharide synthase